MSYLLDNAEALSARRMAVLTQLFDDGTRDALSRIGVRPGWNCLEVGGGSGSIARWLASRVGEGGSVLCTDIDPRHAGTGHGNLSVIRHDITVDALPRANFELVHARLLLIHLEARAAVLTKLVESLAPGGWLLIEDFDVDSIIADEAANPHEVRLPTAEAVRRFLARSGAEPRLGRRLHGMLRAQGLEKVSASATISMVDAAHPACALMRVNFEQLGPRLVAEGLVSESQWRSDLDRLDRDDWSAPSPMMWRAAGRKPSAASR